MKSFYVIAQDEATALQNIGVVYRFKTWADAQSRKDSDPRIKGKIFAVVILEVEDGPI